MNISMLEDRGGERRAPRPVESAGRQGLPVAGRLLRNAPTRRSGALPPPPIACRLALFLCVLMGSAAPPFRAALPQETRGRGAAELSLDRAAVLFLVQAALPPAVSVAIPGAGAIEVTLAPPGSVTFVGGGVETDVVVGVPALRWESRVHARYEPDINAEDGVIRLRAVTAEPDLALPFSVDLAPLLPVVDLPRAFGWSLRGPGGDAVAVHCSIEAVRIEDERLIVELGLVAR